MISIISALVIGVGVLIPISGKKPDCPLGYYRQGDYCMPGRPDAPRVIPKTGRDCPLGYYKQGGYCVEDLNRSLPPRERSQPQPLQRR